MVCRIHQGRSKEWSDVFGSDCSAYSTPSGHEVDSRAQTRPPSDLHVRQEGQNSVNRTVVWLMTGGDGYSWVDGDYLPR